VLGTPFAAILLTVTVATANTYELGYRPRHSDGARYRHSL
jgi:hypothetical protein